MRKHAGLEEKGKTVQEKVKKEADVAVGEGEGQTSESVGFREALEDLLNKNVQGLLSTGCRQRHSPEHTRPHRFSAIMIKAILLVAVVFDWRPDAILDYPVFGFELNTT